MMYRDPNLLKLAKGEMCLLQVADDCLGDEGSTTVAAHSNLMAHGKGRGLKAEDCYTVWSCYKCHSNFDQGGVYSREEKSDIFYAALLRQIEEWRKIAINPAVRPWKAEAARNALEYLINQYKEDTNHG
jgi:hypothetical protein